MRVSITGNCSCIIILFNYFLFAGSCRTGPMEYTPEANCTRVAEIMYFRYACDLFLRKKI